MFAMVESRKPKLLVIELWGLGDLVIATPFLRAAIERYEVTLLAKPYARALQPSFWPGLNVEGFVAPWTAFRGKYWLWAWPWRELASHRRSLLRQEFDIGLSARWDPRDHAMLKLSGARQRLGFPRVRSEAFLTHPLTRPDSGSHRYENWRALGQALGLTLPGFDQLRPLGPARGAEVLVHTGAAQPVRVWPLERYREVVRRLRGLGYAVRVACDPAQLPWWQNSGEPAAEAPATVTRLLETIRPAGAFFGNDSGPAHLAAISGVPTFTLFGPQLPEWFAPIHPAAEYLEGKPCPYKPCSDYCRFSAPVCLTGETLDEVWPRLLAFLSRTLPLAKAA